MITTRHLGVLVDVEAGLIHPPIHGYLASTICQLLIDLGAQSAKWYRISMSLPQEVHRLTLFQKPYCSFHHSFIPQILFVIQPFYLKI